MKSAGPRDLYEQARRRIPGGTQLLSKRPEMFLPNGWPTYYREARGIEVVAVDGRRYVDMANMGVGACVLGYADPDVDAAVREAVARGVACTLNAPEEVELAELLCELHPWAGMVRYTRSGGEAMAVAVRIARAHTRRDVVAFCGYHGWSDWYLAANLGDEQALDGHLMPGLDPAGVPRALRGTAFPFFYNRIDQLEAIVREHGHNLAAIVMEPRRGEAPEPGFLEGVRALADETGAVLVFDEITTGFRMTVGGIHRMLGVEPDIAVFAKAMANGYAMAAVIGREPVMEAAQSTFISSTNWTERIGPTAALATIRKLKRHDVPAYICRVGEEVRAGWLETGERAGLPVRSAGLPCSPELHFDHPEGRTLITLFVKRMLERGYLTFFQFKPSWAHRGDHVAAYLAHVEEVFGELAEAVQKGDASERLAGPPSLPGFFRLTEGPREAAP